MIYFDYAANTPVDKRVLEKYNEITLKYFGNPNSLHKLGVEAKKEIDNSSEIIANYFNTKKENIIYTSGSSESNNLVIKGIADRYQNKGKHIIISEIEHSSVIAPCNYNDRTDIDGKDVPLTTLDKNGNIDLEQLKKSLREDTILVSIAVVDSELGTIQPISEIAKIVKENSKAYFHTDATQAIGKVNIDYKYVDFLTFAPHKFFGINGSGVLINFNDIKITPLIHGGKSTTIYRSGTPVSANAVCIAMALQLATKDLEKKINYVKELNSYLIKKLKMINGISINSPKYAIPNTINFSIKNAKIIVNKLYEKGVYVSMQSACSLGTSPSKSVYAFTKSKERASNSIRVSITHITTKKQINEFIRILKEIINEDNNY